MISPSQPHPAGDTGGSGGLVPTGNRDHTTTRDMRLIERLARRRDWNISDVAFERLPNEILLIALNKAPDGSLAEYPLRERLSAARTLAHMNRQNQDNHPLPTRHDHLHLHADVDTDSVIDRIEQEAVRRGLIGGEVIEGESSSGNSNGNGKA